MSEQERAARRRQASVVPLKIPICSEITLRSRARPAGSPEVWRRQTIPSPLSRARERVFWHTTRTGLKPARSASEPSWPWHMST